MYILAALGAFGRRQDGQEGVNQCDFPLRSVGKSVYWVKILHLYFLCMDLDSEQWSTCLLRNLIGKIYATQIGSGSFGSPEPSNGLRRFGKSVVSVKILGLHCQRWF